MAAMTLIDSMWIFPVLGALAGVLAGLLGIGGGLVLVAALAWVLPRHGVPAHAVMHAALASSLASIVLTAMSSAWAHYRRGGVLLRTAGWMVPGLLLGAWLGTALAVHLNGHALRWLVAGYCVLAAAQMLLGTRREASASMQPTTAPGGAGYTLAGGVIGAVSAVVGIGGGSMTVPLLVWRGVAPVQAVGTSSLCGVAIGLASAVGYMANAPNGALPAQAIGYVYLPAAVGIAVASIAVAPLGVRLAHAIGGPALKRVFVVFLLLVAASLLMQ